MLVQHGVRITSGATLGMTSGIIVVPEVLMLNLILMFMLMLMLMQRYTARIFYGVTFWMTSASIVGFLCRWSMRMVI